MVSVRPAPVMLIDDKYMFMRISIVLPALVQVFLVSQAGMAMLNDIRIVGWPGDRGNRHAHYRNRCQHHESGWHAKLGAHEAGDWIRDQPAYVRERKLRGEYRWPAIGASRSA